MDLFINLFGWLLWTLFRKRVRDFVKTEEGEISKRSILTLGSIVGTAAVATVLTSKGAEATINAWLSPSEGPVVTIHGSYS
ncbi:MAG: hypothetical protein ABIG95_06740 [Candidatus Woesearchaeota archaeon]